jgi:hypothetical protein
MLHLAASFDEASSNTHHLKLWGDATMTINATIWVNEQLDPSGMVHACIACSDETKARACHESFSNNLDSQQRAEGWVARLRTVKSWDDVPVAPLSIS